MKCTRKGCDQLAERNNLCNKHYKREEWLDNTDRNNLGFLKFCKEVLPTWARDEFGELHKDVAYAFFQMYSKKNTDKYDRQLAEIAFRGAAKTTLAKMILAYICCFGLEKFVVYCSETHTFAVNDTNDVKNELSNNQIIRYYFGIISSKALLGQEGEWSKTNWKTSTGVSVIPRGVGQQIRSALKGSWRPTLAIVNDMYSKESVKTELSRENAKGWFFNDLSNAVDDIEGKMFFDGTILHEDTVPVLLMKNSNWKSLVYPVMNIDDFHDCLTHCTVEGNQLILPTEAKIVELEKGYRITWPSRLSLRYILRKYSDHLENHRENDFYQEYFHIVVSPGDRPIKDDQIKVLKMELFRKNNFNWLRVFFPTGEKVFPVHVYFGIDPASSLNANAKYSVIAIVCINQYRQLFIYGYSRGHYTLRDEFLDGVAHINSDIVTNDTSILRRQGIVDQVIRMVRIFRPDAGQVETTQAQYYIYTELYRLMGKNDAYHILTEEKPVANKEERDATRISPYFQTGNAYLNEGLNDLVIELKSFPRGTTIDIIDAIYHALANVTLPESRTLSGGSTLKKIAVFESDTQNEEGYETDFDLLM